MIALFRHGLVCIAAVLLILVSNLAYGQVHGHVEGYIRNVNGSIVNGAVVRILGTNRGAISRNDGRYFIGGLMPGSYDVKVEGFGYEPALYKLHIATDSSSRLDALLDAPVDAGFRILTSANPFSVSLGTNTTDDTISVQLFRADNPLDMLLSTYSGYVPASWSTTDKMGWSLEGSSERSLVKELKHVLPQKLRGHPANIPVAIPEPGFYIVEARGTGHSQRTQVVISDLAVTFKPDGEKLIAYVANVVTGRRIPNMELACVVSGDQIGMVRTDADGIAVIPLPLLVRNYPSQTMMLYGEHEGSIVAANWTYRYTTTGIQPTLFLHTDKPVYRPEQTVNYRGILRGVGVNGSYSIIKASTFVVVRASDGAMIRQDTLMPSDLGTFDGSLVLGAEPALGDYTIDVMSTGINQRFTFTVAEYEKPEFAVELSIPRARYRVGETLEAKIKARYFFGSDVTDGDVEYAIYRTPMPGFGDSPQWNGPASPLTTEMIHTGNTRLRSDGTCTITYATDGKTQRDYIYSVRANVTDKSRRAIDASAATTVTRGEFAIAVNTSKNLYTAPETIDADVRLSDFDGGKPGRIPFTLTARRITWTPDTTGAMVKQQETLWTKESVTDEDGRARLTSPVTHGGYIELTAEARDSASAVVTGSGSLYAYDSFYDRWTTSDRAARIIPERENYRTGDTIRALVIAPSEQEIDALVTAESNKLHQYMVRQVGRRAALVEFPATAGLAPNFFITLLTFQEGRTMTTTREIAVRQSEHELELAIIADKRTYRPGEKGKLTIRARDSKGRPVRNADVALAMVDASIYEIAPDATPKMLGYFYPKVRNAIITQTSIGPDQGIMSWQHQRRRITIPTENVAVVTTTSSGRTLSARSEDMPRSARTTVQKSGHSIRGGRETENTIRIDAASTADEFSGGFGSNADNQLGPTSASLSPDDLHVPTPDGNTAIIRVANSQPAMAAAVLRSTFKDVMLWLPSVRTGEDGTATVELPFPDNLTTWRVAARAIDEQTSVGETTYDVITRKNILVRMETPRFMIQGDEMLLATTVHNYLPTDKVIEVQIAGKNVTLGERTRTITIPAYGEKRIDWPVSSSILDTARFIVRALSDEESDAMELAVPVLPPGMARSVVSSVALRRDDKMQRMTLDIPEGSAKEGRMLTLSLAPSASSSMLGALDGLVSYPYGCVEQTMSRFLPTIAVANALEQIDLPFDENKSRELPKMVEQGLNRLYALQKEGGWGWWRNDASNAVLTAYVMFGLHIAREAGYDIDPERFEQGMNALRPLVDQPEIKADPTTLAYVLYVTSSLERGENKSAARKRIKELAAREDISSYTVALLALAAKLRGENELADNLAGRLVLAAQVSNDMAHWKAGQFDHRWQNDVIETSALAVQALLKIRGHSDLVQQGVDWLLSMRQGQYWVSTRQTAVVIYSLTEYLKEMGIGSGGYRTIVRVNGMQVFDGTFIGADLSGSEKRVFVHAPMLRDGENEVTIEKSGHGGLWVSARLDYRTGLTNTVAEDNGFEVTREYFRLVKERKGDRYIYRKEPFQGTVKTGEELFVKIKVRTEKAREFFMLEDHFPAGCEVVSDVGGFIIEGEREYSGVPAGQEDTWRWWYADRDVRDEKIAFFATRLEKGEYTFSYILRAQIPGNYMVMPALASLAYYPEVAGNSAPMQIRIQPEQASLR